MKLEERTFGTPCRVLDQIRLHDGTKIQSTKLAILMRFYFHDVLELKANFHENFRFVKKLSRKHEIT